MLLECGHGGLCAGCAGRLWKQPGGGRACPLCRREFAGVVRIRDPAAHPVRNPPPALPPPLLSREGDSGRGREV